MKILVSGLYYYGTISGALMFEILQKEIEAGNEVYFLTCSSSLKACYFNVKADTFKCNTCNVIKRNGLELIEGKFKEITLSQLKEKYKPTPRLDNQYPSNARSLVDYCIDEFKLGESIRSNFLSKTRNRDINDFYNSEYTQYAFFEALELYQSVCDFIDDMKFDRVINFNGRWDFSRLILFASLKSKVDCYNYEQARPGGYLEVYKNTLPHDFKYRKIELVDKFWDASKLNFEEKYAIADIFYKKKRNRIAVNDRIYTNKQEIGLIPNKIEGKKLITIYTSSDDEFASLGDLYKNYLNSTQHESAEEIAKYVNEKKNLQLWIRLHPNQLALINTPELQRIVALHNPEKGVEVILPNAKFDTYAMLDASDIVITFGSSIGLEAAHAQKPVVLLADSPLYSDSLFYKPTSFEQLFDLLQSDLQPKESIDHLKFAYYYTEGGVKSSYYIQDKLYGKKTFKGVDLTQLKFWDKIKIHWAKKLKLKNKL